MAEVVLSGAQTQYWFAAFRFLSQRVDFEVYSDTRPMRKYIRELRILLLFLCVSCDIHLSVISIRLEMPIDY